LSIDEVRRYHEEMARRRDSLPYEIDGIVMKVDDLAWRARLRTTARHPRWALAYKFAPREEQTTIEDIVVQVGRTGVLTPVAVLRPVQIGGYHHASHSTTAEVAQGPADQRVVRWRGMLSDRRARVYRRPPSRPVSCRRAAGVP
jgi:hypothetical protein